MQMGEQCVATVDFTAESGTELDLRVGDRVTVTDRNGQWAYGSKGSRQGWFPADNVEAADNGNSRFPPQTPPKPSQSGRARHNGGDPGRSDNDPVGSGGTSGRHISNSNFANNLMRIKDVFEGGSLPSTPPVSTPKDDRGTRVDPRPPAIQTRVSGINYAPTPSYDSSHNNYNGHNSDGNHNAAQRTTTPAAPPPPTLPISIVRPPVVNPDFRAPGPSPAMPSKPPPNLPPPNHGRRLSSSSGGAPASPVANGRPNYSFQFCVEAQHPYTGQRREELSFAARERLDIIERPSPSSDWWRARNKAGEIGLVPTNYVKEIPQSTPVLAERLWYLPRIKRDETEQRMRRQPTECFVIRDSEAFPGSFTLSVKGPDKVRHIKITTVTDGYHVGDKKFDSLDAVVDFYRNSPIYIADDGSYKLLLCRPLIVKH